MKPHELIFKNLAKYINVCIILIATKKIRDELGMNSRSMESQRFNILSIFYLCSIYVIRYLCFRLLNILYKIEKHFCA